MASLFVLGLVYVFPVHYSWVSNISAIDYLERFVCEITVNIAAALIFLARLRTNVLVAYCLGLKLKPWSWSFLSSLFRQKTVATEEDINKISKKLRHTHMMVDRPLVNLHL